MSYTERLREKVYNFILRSGAAGLTDEEISDGLRIPGDMARPRRNELVAAQRIVATNYRRMTTRGRTAQVWMAAGVAKKLALRA